MLGFLAVRIAGSEFMKVSISIHFYEQKNDLLTPWLYFYI